VFELAEEALDEIALSIDSRIDGTPDDAAGAAWNAGFGAGARDEFEDGVTVIASVGDHGDGRGQASEQLRDEGHVRSLAGRQEEPYRQTILVHHGVDFGAQSSTRTANGVIRAPFFPPAACWWARTMELSISCIDWGDLAAKVSNTFSQTPALAHRL
jgi:hypothetical protein